MEEGVDAFKQSLAIKVKLLGDGHTDSLKTRHDLAELYMELKRPVIAEELLDKNM